MKPETIIQLLALIILAGLALFYNPASADFEGRMIFFGLIIAILLFFVFMDLYNLIESNNRKIKLFNEKLSLLERIKNLENSNKKRENETK